MLKKQPTLSSLFVREIRKEFPFLKGQRLLLAVSGGLDSMAMLYLFLENRERFQVEIAVAHINHHLRPTACRDSSFVDNFCQERGIPFYLSEINDDFWTSHTANREDKARKERYRLLTEIAKKQKIQYVVTAHHRDDQIETILMRLFERGTGLHGLAGIPLLTKREGVAFIRPLLRFSREELKRYMAGRRWLEDESNRDTTIRRNFYRHRVIPFLRERLGLLFEGHLVSLAEEAAGYREVLETALELFWESHRGTGRNRYVFDKKEIAKLPRSFRESALAALFRKTRGFSFGKRTLRDIGNFLASPEKRTCQYGPIHLVVTGEKVFFSVGENS